jgi:hypothetical protein
MYRSAIYIGYIISHCDVFVKSFLKKIQNFSKIDETLFIIACLGANKGVTIFRPPLWVELTPAHAIKLRAWGCLPLEMLTFLKSCDKIKEDNR